MICTPAPWRANGNKVRAFDRNQEFTIASCATTGKWKHTEEAEANNARLMAASHELLDACKYVVAYHREHDSGEGELFGMDFVTSCIAAIHKAEGK